MQQSEPPIITIL